MPAIVSRILSLKDVGVFRDASAVSAMPRLRRYNLIYGFNGSGKSTLSRVFECLQTGQLSRQLPEFAEFKFQLSDGTELSHTKFDQLKNRLLVFNSDFIEQNLKWSEKSATPIFYLGREHANLVDKLRTLEERLADFVKDRDLADTKHKRSAANLAKRRTDLARTIAEQLGLGRRYNAVNLASDYDKPVFDNTHKLSSDRQRECRAIIAQEAPLPKRPLIGEGQLAFRELIGKVRALIGASLSALAVEEFRQHSTMLKWVREGFVYHQEHHLSACLFCGNVVTEARFKELAAAIDARFEELSSETLLLGPVYKAAKRRQRLSAAM